MNEDLKCFFQMLKALRVISHKRIRKMPIDKVLPIETLLCGDSITKITQVLENDEDENISYSDICNITLSLTMIDGLKDCMESNVLIMGLDFMINLKCVKRVGKAKGSAIDPIQNLLCVEKPHVFIYMLLDIVRGLDLDLDLVR